MDELKIDYNKSYDILKNIDDYMEKISLILEGLNDKIESIDEQNVWQCNNAILLKDTGVQIVEKFNKELEKMKININSIKEKIGNYEKIDSEIIEEFNS